MGFRGDKILQSRPCNRGRLIISFARARRKRKLKIPLPRTHSGRIFTEENFALEVVGRFYLHLRKIMSISYISNFDCIRVTLSSPFLVYSRKSSFVTYPVKEIFFRFRRKRHSSRRRDISSTLKLTTAAATWRIQTRER